MPKSATRFTVYRVWFVLSLVVILVGRIFVAAGTLAADVWFEWFAIGTVLALVLSPLTLVLAFVLVKTWVFLFGKES